MVLGLAKGLFRTLIELSVLNSFFIFNGNFYMQIEGLGMGLPFGPTFANIFMRHHKQIWLDSCPLSFRPTLFQCYVDDTFLLFRHKNHAMLFLNFLNEQLPNIAFTMECKSDGRHSFLDCQVYREKNGFQTSIFHKSMFSDLGSSFFLFSVPFGLKLIAYKRKFC